jgi:hypothetical protein
MSEEVQTPEQPETPTPEQPVSWVNEDGTFNRDHFADDLGSHSIFDKYANVEELVKGSINAQTMISQKVDDWLGSDNEDAIKSRMKLVGVPDDPSEYEMRYPESFADLPEESQQSLNEYLKESAQWAHENGVSKDVFEKFVERDLNRTMEVYLAQQQEAKEAYDSQVKELKKEWGSDYDNNVKKVENMAKMLNMEGIIPVLHSDPEMMSQFFSGVSRITSDDKIIEGAQTQQLETVKDQMADLQDRMMSYKGSTNDAEYQRMVEKMGKLQRSLPKQREDFPVIG